MAIGEPDRRCEVADTAEIAWRVSGIRCLRHGAARVWGNSSAGDRSGFRSRDAHGRDVESHAPGAICRSEVFARPRENGCIEVALWRHYAFPRA